MKLQDLTFEELEDYPGWYVWGSGTEDPFEAEEKALSLQTEALSHGLYCVAGVVGETGGYGLYLVPAKGARYVIEMFAVGSHGGIGAESVYDEVLIADRMNPLVPYFADEAGLMARFSEPITEELLAVLEESLQSVEPMIEEGDGTIESYVRAKGAIHLWWD